MRLPGGSVRRSTFVRQVVVLAGGTAGAQAINLAALPLLTRLYDPRDFGFLAAFTAALGLCAAVSGLRYPVAIPQPERDEDAVALAGAAGVAVLLCTALVGLAVWLGGARYAQWLEMPEHGALFWLLPLGTLMTGAYGVAQYWATRRRAFPRIARTRLEQALGGSGIQLTTGLLGGGAAGLVLGQIVSNGAGFVGLARRAWREERALLRTIGWPAIRTQAWAYRRYPTWSTGEALANIAGLQVPVMLLAVLIAGAELGFLMLAMRALQAPMALIGTAIGQVYYTRAVDDDRAGRLGTLTRATVLRLALLGWLPMLLLAWLGPDIFALVFGAAWRSAGEWVVWLAPWFFLQFITSPVSMALHVRQRQALALGLQVWGLVLRTAAVLLWEGHAVQAFAVASAVFYLTYLLLILRVVRPHPTRHTPPSHRAASTPGTEKDFSQ